MFEWYGMVQRMVCGFFCSDLIFIFALKFYGAYCIVDHGLFQLGSGLVQNILYADFVLSFILRSVQI